MKIVNEKGKLFGLINLVDLLMVITIVVVAAAAVMMFSSGDDGKDKEDTNQYFVEVAFTVHVPGQTLPVAESIAAAVPRQELTAFVVGDDFLPNFYFVDAWHEPTRVMSPDADGIPIVSYDPLGRQDVWFEIRGLLNMPDEPIYSMVSQEIRIGNRFWVKSELMETDGTIVDFVVSEPIHYQDIEFGASFADIEPSDREAFSIEEPETWGWQPNPLIDILGRAPGA